jgi:hypothetical protein
MDCRHGNRGSAARRGTVVRAVWCAVMFAAGAALLSGCQAAGAVAYAVAGPPSVPARYTPAMEPMAVLVENYQNPALSYLDSEQLAQRIYADLQNHQVAPMIDPQETARLRSSRGATEFRKMNVASVGHALGAKQVLYINIIDSAVDSDASNLIQGQLEMRVQIIDVASGSARWPAGASGGYPVTVELPVLIKSSDADPALAHEHMVASAAANISHLFYAWKPQD